MIPKIAVFSWFGTFTGIKERIHLICEAGFDGIMLALEDEYEPEFVPFAEQVRLCRQAGLEVVNAHSPFAGWNTLWSPSDEEAEPLMNHLKQWIRDCAEHHIPVLVVHTNDMDLGLDIDIEKGIARFQKICDLGASLGVTIAVENVSRIYLLREVLDHVNSPALGFCYDSSHEHMLPCVRGGKLLDEYGPLVAALHLSDNDLYWDKHWIPGKGKIDFEPIVNKLKKTPFDWLTFELIKSEDDSRDALDYLKAVVEQARKLQQIYDQD